MADVASVKNSIKAMKDFMNGKPNPEIPDSSAFGRTIVSVLEEVYFRLEALEREATQINLEARDLRAAYDRKALVEVVFVDKPAKIDIRDIQNWSASPPTGKWTEWVDGAHDFERMVGTGTVDNRSAFLHYAPGVRAYYDNGHIFLDDVDGKTVVVHEMGHWLEDWDAAVRRKATDFLNARTAGEQAELLVQITGNNAYRPNEVSKRDKFLDAYAGKIYSDGSTEIVSMGVQWMYVDPEWFARKDPAYFDFIWKLLRGW
jgi:hypothetical protein